MTAQLKAENFVDALQKFPTLTRVFNPWLDVDQLHDQSSEGPKIRSDQLVRYLAERIGFADNILIAEAPGFQGCHFSGIAMTSERILLGYQKNNNIHREDVFHGEATKTSKHLKMGATEPTATVVWKVIKQSGVDPRKVVLWNSFPFHPMKDSYLSNRKPAPDELEKARYLLEHFLSLFPGALVIPVGRIAEKILENLGITCSPYVRHPANGGATEFRAGMEAYWKHAGHKA